MKLYVLSVGPYRESEVDGVFDSLEAALAAIPGQASKEGFSRADEIRIHIAIMNDPKTVVCLALYEDDPYKPEQEGWLLHEDYSNGACPEFIPFPEKP